MKKNTTKRSLLASVMALALCVIMLVGTTFAWFTDTVSTSVNKIESGKLDVALEMAAGTNEDGSTKWVDAEGKTLQFLVNGQIPAEGTQILWEPGCTYELPALRVVNKGNLALKYKIVITGIGGDVGLNKVIDWTINDEALLADHPLAAGVASEPLTIKGHMQTTAGNEYQEKYIDSISITVYATQDTVENDSYGPNYDADAEYAVATAPVTVVDNKVVGDVTLKSVEKTAEGDHVAVATVPSGAAVNNGVNKLTLTIVETDKPANFEVAATQGHNTLEVKMEGLAANNDKPIKVEMIVEKGLTNFQLFHNGVAMTKVDSAAAVVNDQQYYYDSETGVVTMRTAKFSPFTYTYDKGNWSDHAADSYATPVDTNKKVVTIASAEELALLANEVNGGKSYAGYTVKLTQDIDLGRFMWTPIGTSANKFSGNFDGQNNTISNLNVHDTRKDASGFGLIGYANGQKIINVNIHNAYVYGNSAVAAVLGNGNTTIQNCHLDGQIQIGTSTNNTHLANFNSSYIGGIIGYGYSKVVDCSVKGDEGALIGGRQVGGIYGFAGEGKSDRVVNCTVENVKLMGYKSIGGILGWAFYGNNVKNCSVKDVTLELTGVEENTIGKITGTSWTSSGENDYDEFVGNVAENCTIVVNGKAVNLDSPFDMYATYASGSHYIKRGDNTIIYCENLAQAESIQKAGDKIIKMP